MMLVSNVLAHRRFADSTLRAVLSAAIAIVLSQPIGAIAANQRYTVDATKSRATIHVGKSGAFSAFAGHTHDVVGPIESGSVYLDVDDPSQSHVRLVIAAAALKVSAEGEPPDDVPKVQETMDSDKVLDVGRYPQIIFESTAVTPRPREGDRLDLVINGQLTIRDVHQPVSVPVRVELAGGALTATGRFTIKQTAFGIKPVSVGGVVAVKDALDIEFSIAAKQ